MSFDDEEAGADNCVGCRFRRTTRVVLASLFLKPPTPQLLLQPTRPAREEGLIELASLTKFEYRCESRTSKSDNEPLVVGAEPGPKSRSVRRR